MLPVKPVPNKTKAAAAVKMEIRHIVKGSQTIRSTCGQSSSWVEFYENLKCTSDELLELGGVRGRLCFLSDPGIPGVRSIGPVLSNKQTDTPF